MDSIELTNIALDAAEALNKELDGTMTAGQYPPIGFLMTRFAREKPRQKGGENNVVQDSTMG